jgi:hypothetical protein
MIDSTLFGTTVKDECMAPMVGTSMEGEDPNLTKLESIAILATIAPCSFIALQDVRLNVREEIVDVTETMIMEE